jgi:ipoprotein LpqH
LAPRYDEKVVKRRSAVAVGWAVLLGAALAGCSSSSGKGASTPGSPAPAANVKVVVDGKARHVENHVECVTAANMVFANLGSEHDGITLNLSAGEHPKLNDLTLGTVDGIPLTYTTSNIGPALAVTKTASTYKVVGSASGPSPDGAKDVSKPFDIEFTCPPQS